MSHKLLVASALAVCLPFAAQAVTATSGSSPQSFPETALSTPTITGSDAAATSLGNEEATSGQITINDGDESQAVTAVYEFLFTAGGSSIFNVNTLPVASEANGGLTGFSAVVDSDGNGTGADVQTISLDSDQAGELIIGGITGGETLFLILSWTGAPQADNTAQFRVSTREEDVNGDVPLPAGLPLMLTALAGIGYVRARRA